MPTATPSPIAFVVPGHGQSPGATRGGGGAGASTLPGQVRASVQVGALRAGGAPVRVLAQPGEEVVALHIANGPVLLLHPETARDLMLAQGGAARGAAAPDEVAVPAQLRWSGLEAGAPSRGRGFLGDVVVSAFEVLTGFGANPAADFAASEVVTRVDAQVDAGVYALSAAALPPLKGSGLKRDQLPPSAEPMLVLMHGTFVETVSTFGKLWELHKPLVQDLFTAYGGRVYALDHPTLGSSPVGNALTLAQALPPGARLHLVTHSRGGLVAEVLARAASQRSLGDGDLAFFPSATHDKLRRELQALCTLARDKDIRVERVVRVACPARGTLLASGRLDAYLSVLKWTIELAGVPVVPTLVDFIAEVAYRRADPSLIPGLEAMVPESPLVRWLNAVPGGIDGDLRVVAGDLEGDSIGSWLKTLLADSFYWTDNDIVVQTRSMYGGAPRRGGATFLLDRGGQATHFTYFVNERTAQAVVDALTQAQPAGFRPIGPLSWQGGDSGGARGAEAPATAPGSDGTRPAVFVLPGILGSNLAVDGERIWLSLHIVGGLPRIAYRPQGDGVTPDGAIGASYGDLIRHLGASHDVVEFAYDWRRPLEDEGRRLADAIEQALDARQASGQPVRILAHSMGGLLARTMWLERPATWQRMMAHEGARLLMLGTPNGGSWAPMQVLSGDDTMGNTLAALGSFLDDHGARSIMASMPGFLQLQAGLLDETLALAHAGTWAKLAADDLRAMDRKNWWHGYAGEALEPAYKWGVPPQEVLDQACALRRRLDAQRDGDLGDFAARLLLVVGHAKFTPDGFEVGSDGFVYSDAIDGGDGRVPLHSALLPGVATWTLGCDHGQLSNEARAFDAYVELLATGSTQRLDRLEQPAAARGSAAPEAPAHVRSRPAHGRPSARPPEDERDVFRLRGEADDDASPAPVRGPLRMRVLAGNLGFVRQPLMIGHYRSLSLTGTEAAIDVRFGGVMRTALRAGLYPERPGSSRVFVGTERRGDNPMGPPRPRAVIVVGLGDEDGLGARELAATVRQGVLAWAQRAAELPAGERGGAAGIELSATLIGSGGIGITPGSAARAIAQGVVDANERLAGSTWPTVSQLTLVELYLDRATDALRGLQVLAGAQPAKFRLAPTIAFGVGPLRRQQDNGYRGAAYDLITVSSSADGGAIAFALDTRRARTEVRAQSTQRRLITELVRRAATSVVGDPRLGRTLFQLLVPAELEPFLAGEDSVVLALDAGTAPIPWELMDTGHVDERGDEAEPWAIRCKLLRKLRKSDFRSRPLDANRDDAVLLIGEPFIADPSYPRLPGARAEAEAVHRTLVGVGGVAAGRVVALYEQPGTARPDAAAVINALMERRYRIVHIAGHGEPVERDEAGRVLRTRGVVLSDGIFLGTSEILAMRIVPELVFINCCHVGGHDAGETLRNPDPGAFAATVADALIEIGVRCVVAAGWAVGDDAAAAFATTFYRQLLQRQPFVEAVSAARRAARQAEPDGNTWAAYQCYGDPDWVFDGQVGDAQALRRVPDDPGAGVASPAELTLALEEIAVRSRLMGLARTGAQASLRALEQRFAADWGAMGAVAEAFAVAWAAAGDRAQAIAWYERALAAEDASASIKVQEQLGNLRVRQAWSRGRDAAPGTAAYRGALEEIDAAAAALLALASAQPTVERWSLCGSAAKRRAMLMVRSADAGAPAEALLGARQAVRDGYARAEALAAAHGDPGPLYPALNRIAADLVLGHAPPAGGEGGFDALAAALRQRSAADSDFWTAAASIELEWLAAVAQSRLADSLVAVRAAFIELHLLVDAPSNWESVADQARFVLGAYRARATAAEAAAADTLQQLLDGFAGTDR